MITYSGLAVSSTILCAPANGNRQLAEGN